MNKALTFFLNLMSFFLFFFVFGFGVYFCGGAPSNPLRFSQMRTTSMPYSKETMKPNDLILKWVNLVKKKKEFIKDGFEFYGWDGKSARVYVLCVDIVRIRQRGLSQCANYGQHKCGYEPDYVHRIQLYLIDNFSN